METERTCSTCKYAYGILCMHKPICSKNNFKYWELEEETDDLVNHPSHYTAGKFETIDVIQDILTVNDLTGYQGYLLGNIIKYIYRFNNKNGVEDLNKAAWYLDRLIEEREK